MNTKTTYIALTLIFVVSLATAILFPVGDVFRALSAIPAVVALFGALFQILRDRIAHERSLLVLEAQNSFAIGATSHMAIVAFDKHVMFCEEYVAEMHKALVTLFRNGPTAEELQHSSALWEIRNKWAVWLTPRVDSELERFEAVVRRIGANAQSLDLAPGAQGRSVRIEEMYSLFNEVVGWEKREDTPLTQDRAITTIIGKLRQVLGIEELTALRSTLVSRALDHLKKDDW